MSASSAARRHLSHHLRRFKLITFDVTDTLLAFRRPPEVEYARAVQHLGYGEASADRMAAAFRHQFRTMSALAPNFGRDGRPQMTWESWWRRLIAGVLRSARADLDERAVRRIADHLIDLYETAECWRPTAGARELLQALRWKGDDDAVSPPALGVISNFDPRLKWLLENVDLPPVDFVLASYEVGALKPNPQIFDLALKMAEGFRTERWRAAELRPAEALHVGNTPLLDYVGAREAGWSSVLIADDVGPAAKWRRVEGVKEAHVYRSLAELLQRLERPEDVEWD